MNKKVAYGFFTFVCPVIVGFTISKILLDDPASKNIPASVSYLIGILFSFLSHFLSVWIYLVIDFNDFKEDFSLKIKSITTIGSIIENFAEANMMFDNLFKSVKSDLDFDKNIKLKKNELEFHLYLSRIKYQDYLSSHYIFHADKPKIQKIPKNYFENPIWIKLVDGFKRYLSIQIIDKETKELYLNDTTRRDWEITRLYTKIEQGTLEVFNKLFIVQDDYISANNEQIIDKDLFDYLFCWLQRFEKRSNAQLKIIKFSNANGSIGYDNIEDMGIYDKILAIQKIDDPVMNSVERKQYGLKNERTFTFEFNLDSSVTTDYETNFNALFSQAINLQDFFCPEIIS